MNVTERFLKYVAFDTQSDENSESCPSTDKQKALGAFLVEDMKAIGVTDAHMDEHGYVYGSVPASAEGLPAIGLIAHMDVSDAAPGENIRPRIIENYDGGPVTLANGLVLDPAMFPDVARARGKRLIVTDGNTSLGADDKAGVAEIMDAVQYIVAHPEFKHGPIKIGFTPDEEIGRGVVKFDVPASARTTRTRWTAAR